MGYISLGGRSAIYIYIPGPCPGKVNIFKEGLIQPFLLKYLNLSWASSPLPRTYTKDFAEKICSLMPLLMEGGGGRPPVDSAPAHELFQATPWSDWGEAKFKDCIRYLRGNKSLALPERWRNVIPTHL